jgi:Domain of unknown function (DUF4442)
MAVTTAAINPGTEVFLRLVRSRMKFGFFMLAKLPSAFFSGVRVRYADADKCEVTVPYKWFSQNPFKSTYFACLAMAAEMSTGLLAMAQTYHRKPGISMLVVGLEAVYHKKATGITRFECHDGPAMQEAIAESIATGEARSVAARSVGKNNSGEVVAEFTITWSFKARKEGV